MNLTSLLDVPTEVRVFRDDTPATPAQPHGAANWLDGDVTVGVVPLHDTTVIRVHAPKSAIARVAVRWRCEFPAGAVFLGDAWERSYGDLQWRSTQPERILPWYFAAFDPTEGGTVAAGVKTAPAAMCFWTLDSAGVTLWLDLRNGGMPSIPGDRWIDAATVVTVSSTSTETPTQTVRRLCARMCDAPRQVAAPVCGNNNWYYAYGHNFDADQVKRDAALLADLAGGHANRPYCVIDAGWSPGGVCPGGPWTAGRPGTFPDMPRLAQDIAKTGVRPGIWIRPTALTVVTDTRRLRPGPQKSEEKALDLTMPENLALVHDDIRRMHEWGYQLIKHDFSTWDTLGRWGFEMGGADRSRLAFRRPVAHQRRNSAPAVPDDS